jgi:hypothetical protein
VHALAVTVPSCPASSSLAVLAAFCAVAVGAVIGEPLLVAAAAGYLCSSFLYSVRLRHVPFVEMVLVASGSCCACSAGRRPRTCGHRCGSCSFGRLRWKA